MTAKHHTDPHNPLIQEIQRLQTASAEERAMLLERVLPSRSDSSVLIVTCRPSDYSASIIARAVEDCDAHLLNLNVTADTTSDGDAVIYLRVSHRDPSSVARSLSRYGYEVTATSSDISPQSDDEARLRALEVLHYLSV